MAAYLAPKPYRKSGKTTPSFRRVLIPERRTLSKIQQSSGSAVMGLYEVGCSGSFGVAMISAAFPAMGRCRTSRRLFSRTVRNLTTLGGSPLQSFPVIRSQPGAFLFLSNLILFYFYHFYSQDIRLVVFVRLVLRVKDGTCRRRGGVKTSKRCFAGTFAFRAGF